MDKSRRHSQKAINQRGELEEKQWRCDYCHFDNCHLLKNCQICQNQKPSHKVSKRRQESMLIVYKDVKLIGDDPLEVYQPLPFPQNQQEGLQHNSRSSSQKARIDKQYSLCSFCDSKLSSCDRTQHAKKCAERKSFLNKQMNPSFERCSNLQISTILYMHEKSERLHNESRKSLVLKLQEIGFNEEDLDNLHHYIIHNAPVIVHLKANSCFKYFVSDTNYRNAFEIYPQNQMDIQMRVTWEDRMFDTLHHDAKPFERVKYGTINFTNDPNGVEVCHSYGLSYFLLKPHVRDRCTITDVDSCIETATIGTFRFVYHVLNKLSSVQLKSAIQASKGKQMLSTVIESYKEIQIHGPLEFAKDISRLYICKQQITSQQVSTSISQFCAKYNIECEYFDYRKLSGKGKKGIVSAKDRFIGIQHGKPLQKTKLSKNNS